MNLLRFSTEKQIHWEHRTARILLREFEARDEDAIVALFSEVSAQQFILRNQRNPEMTRKFAKAAAFHAGNPERVGYHFIVENLHTEEVMGICGITRAWRNSKMSEIGWHLGERFSGQGFATEAAEAVINFAFEDRGVLRVQGDCFYHNFAVRRIFEKIGMTRPRFSTITNWLL
jgi:RimJ/RimL family protein N-acetyltransferase